jgi:hypothetical protein
MGAAASINDPMLGVVDIIDEIVIEREKGAI